MANIIEIKDLVKKFGDFPAVNGISMSVKSGELFGLLGPNGSGKTTIINIIVSLLVATSGKVLVNGLDTLKYAEEIKKSIGVMTQETVVETDLTARENLELFAELYQVPAKEIDKRVKDALELSDLTEFADKKAGTFSGGMQRRLELVKSMIQSPKIMILDEPTSGLDVQNRTKLWARIKELNKNGITIILTTQYLEEADALCDRIAIIDHGKIKAIGTSSELKALLGQGNILEIITKPERIKEVVQLLKKFNVDANIKVDRIVAVLGGKEPTKTFTKIANAIEEAKIPVLTMSIHLPTLDDVFLELTGSKLRDETGEMKEKVRWR